MRHLTEEQIIKYQLKELSDEELQFVEQHLHNCMNCFEQLTFLSDLTAAWEHEEADRTPPNCLQDSIMATINQSQKSIPKKKAKRYVWVQFIVSSAATLLFANIGLFDNVQSFSYQFVGGISKATSQIEIITHKGTEVMGNIESGSFMNQKIRSDKK